MELVDHIIALEKTLLTNEVRRSKAKLKALISEDFKEVGASGTYFGLAEVLARLPGEDSWSAKTRDWEFRVLGQGIVQTMHKAFVQHDNHDAGSYSIRTSIWREESGGWKMVFHQGTNVAPFDL